MISRRLSEDEKKTLLKMAEFIKDKHAGSEGHSYSHVIEVAETAIEIAKKIPEETDPFIVMAGALFHDIGRVNRESGMLHGLEGGAIAEEYLESIGLDPETVNRITRIVVRHTPTSMIPPETAEEKVVYDADTLERLGWVGVLRGLMGKKGSIESIFERVIKKRESDYGKLHYDVSKEMGKRDYEDLKFLIGRMKEALEKRKEEIERIEFLEE
ncbi:MAG: HD domain-containing protein [Methanobacteriota archaeon]|nr:MAG: HD domain-containing protein [Euryarchaeota archaeon]